MGVETTAVGCCSRGESWVSAPNTAWASGSYSQGAGCRPMGGKLLRGNFVGKDGFWLN